MAPTTRSQQFRNLAPQMISLPNGSIRVRHREYVCDVVAQIAEQFLIVPYAINPGNGQLFKWLEAVGLSYESYIFNKLEFQFESTASTTDRGSVMLGIDFDADDPTPLSKQELMSFSGAVRSNIWSSCDCRAEPSDLRKFGVQRYTRSAAVPPGTDIKTYDVGNFYWAIQGTQANVACGEIYVDYDVTFFTPQPLGLTFTYSRSARAVCNSGNAVGAPVGNTCVTTGGLRISWRSTNSLYFDSIGEFLVVYTLVGSGLDETDLITMTCPYGGTVATVMPVNTYAAVAKTSCVGVYSLTTHQPNAQLHFTATNATTVTELSIRVAPYKITNG